MNSQTFKRKLTTILSADVAGYGRLMSEDEPSTVLTMTRYRDVMATLVKQHRGRVVDSPGDNVLAEFASVVDAVQCAVAVQKEIQARNTDLPEGRRMSFRIGINLGDVIEEGERIYGDGVNIAAAFCLLLLILAAALWVHFANAPPREKTEPVKETASPSSERPAIAVLPFADMSEGSEQASYFSDGITEDIITGLAAIPKLSVIARNSTFAYKGKSVNAKQVGRELGVGYILEGSVQKAGDRVRITAQLIDADTGHHIWAERYDREFNDIFSLQDEIVLQIMRALQLTLSEGQRHSIKGKAPKSLDAYLNLLKGRSYFMRPNPENNTRARQLFEDAIALDPEYAVAYMALSRTHLRDVWYGWTRSPRDSFARAMTSAEKSLALDSSDAGIHGLMSQIYLFRGQYEKAIAKGERARALSPNSIEGYGALGMSLYYGGRYEEAVRLFEEAIALGPMPPTWLLHNLGNGYLMAGRYGDAIASYKKALHRNPKSLWAQVGLTAAYSMTGREKEAGGAAEQILKANPLFSLDYFERILPYENQTDKERFVGALRKAGLDKKNDDAMVQ